MTKHYPGMRDDTLHKLTRRGYRRTNPEIWDERTPSESTAPPVLNDGVKDRRPSLADWGVTVEQAREMLHRQVCPVCGQGPWKSPLNHVARKHGIDRFTMRDLCGLTVCESVADPALSERFAERSRARDMGPVTEASLRRSPQRWTVAGRAKTAANLQEWEQANPQLAHEVRIRAGKAGSDAAHRVRGCGAYGKESS